MDALSTFASFALYLRGVALAGSITGSLLGAAEPVSASVVAAVWLGMVLTGDDWAGLVLMLLMLLFDTLCRPGSAKQSES